MSSSDNPEPFHTVSCQRLRIVDEKDLVRIEMSAGSLDSGPGIILYDSNGNERIVIHVTPNNSTEISLKRNGGHPGISLRASDTESNIRLFASNGEAKLTLEVGADGTPRLNGTTIDEEALLLSEMKSRRKWSNTKRE